MKYKVRQVLLQSATAFFITKCDGLLLQSATAFLLQSATSVITKCDDYYKVRQYMDVILMPNTLLLSDCLQCLAFEVIMFLYLVSMGGGGDK